jgi:hypothetical protein
VTSGNEIIPASTRQVTRRSAAQGAGQGARRLAAPATPRWGRRRGVLGIFAALSVLGFIGAYVGPTGAALAEAAPAVAPMSVYSNAVLGAQSYHVETVAEGQPASLDRGNYTVYVTPKPTPTPTPTPKSPTTGKSSSGSGSGWAPPFVTPDPGTAQAIAYDMVIARGWSDADFGCLVALWNRESGWRVNAFNSGSGAYGIPQALPGSKMASAGADWETNPATQISWGLGYIGGRYGTPCGAWGHSQSTGWY